MCTLLVMHECIVTNMSSISLTCFNKLTLMQACWIGDTCRVFFALSGYIIVITCLICHCHINPTGYILATTCFACHVTPAGYILVIT